MKPIIVLFEKVASTYVQVFLTAWLAADSLGASTAQAAAIAAIPAALTVIANGLVQVPEDLPFYPRLALRTIRTYAVTFIGFFTAMPVFDLSTDTLQLAILAAFPAALAVLKGGLATMVGDPESPALLPASAEHG